MDNSLSTDNKYFLTKKIYAATATPVIIGENKELKVLIAKRTPDSSFFPGYHVFPGGKISNEDVILADQLEKHRESKEGGYSEATFRIAVIREFFEETGVLLLKNQRVISNLENERDELLEEKITFQELLEKKGISPGELAIDSLVYAGTQITPPFSNRVYYARYYFFPMKKEFPVKHNPSEYTESGFYKVKELLKKFENNQIRLPPPTLHVLNTLAKHGDMEKAAKFLEKQNGLPPGLAFPVLFSFTTEAVPIASNTLPPTTTTNHVFVGKNEFVLIDPGAHGPEAQKFLEKIINKKISQGLTFKAIVLTHHHIDHVEFAPELREKYGVPIISHSETARQLRFPVDTSFEKDTEIELRVTQKQAVKLKLLHTPGHTEGSITVVEPLTNTFIVGDLLAGAGTVIISPRTGDLQKYLASLQKLLEMSPSLIIPGHGPVIAYPKQKLLQYIRHRQNRHKQIKEAVLNGASSFDQIVETVYSQTPEQLKQIAKMNVYIHLKALKQQEPSIAKQIEELLKQYESNP